MYFKCWDGPDDEISIDPQNDSNDDSEKEYDCDPENIPDGAW